MAVADEQRAGLCAKLCLDCLRSCKQEPTVTVVFCPRYRSPAAPLRLDPPSLPGPTERLRHCARTAR